MKLEEKRKFVKDLIGSVQASILMAVESMPEKWNGIELREYIAETFARHSDTAKWDKRRYAEYRNEIVVNSKL